MSKTIFVIPCYNEEKRLSGAPLKKLLEGADIEIVLVDDGSTDGTPALLDGLARQLPRLHIVQLDKNRGKAEAVRHGLRRALVLVNQTGEKDAIVAFSDADFATPPEELIRLLRIFQLHPERQCLMGARVRLLGLEVRRSFFRHFMGRIFATLASMTLRMTVYDTQCGAKFFRASPVLGEVLALPFRSRWAFDVELLGRLSRYLNEKDFLEVSLHAWDEIEGSKVTLRSTLRMGLDLVRIYFALRFAARVDSKAKDNI
jgi:dolichyl-phosphate beta-glucosyltransferase